MSNTGPDAMLVLEDGTTLRGTGFGGHGESFGEMVFNTGMTGYQETLTDPSYHRQVVVMTFPQIGVPEQHHPTSHHRNDPELIAKKAKIDTYEVQLLTYFLEKLKAMNIRTIEVHHEDEFFTVNCLAVRPGRVIMSETSKRTLECLDKAGIEVIPIEFEAVYRGGGGIHCSTAPLVRDRV